MTDTEKARYRGSEMSERKKKKRRKSDNRVANVKPSQVKTNKVK